MADTLSEAGEYQNASEAMRDALRALQQRRREDKLKLAALRAEIETGSEISMRETSWKLDDGELEQYLARLKPRRSRRKRTTR